MTHTGWRMAACLIFASPRRPTSWTAGSPGRYQLVTSFGKVADPIADKALTGSALILLSGTTGCPGG